MFCLVMDKGECTQPPEAGKHGLCRAQVRRGCALFAASNAIPDAAALHCTQLPDGSEIPLPPILLGKLGSDPQKKTVCIYGHLDVQPAALEDGWDSEPFTLVERDGEAPVCQGLLPARGGACLP